MPKTTTPVRRVEYWVSPASGSTPLQVLQVKDFTTPPVTRPVEDTTCHEDTEADKTLGTPETGTCSITVLANLNDAAHLRLRDLAKSASAAVGFAKGYADGQADPTSWTSGAWVMPDSRSFLSVIGTLTNWREGTPIGGSTTWQFDIIPTGVPICNDKVTFAITNAAPNGQEGVAYAAFTYAVVGDVPAVTFAITAGALPTGVSLNTSTGALSGTPSADGEYTYTVTATDAEGQTATLAETVTIAAP